MSIWTADETGNLFMDGQLVATMDPAKAATAAAKANLAEIEAAKFAKRETRQFRGGLR